MNEQQNTLTNTDDAYYFSESHIRTAVGDKGIVWFCAKDVYSALNLEWRGSQGLKRYPANWQTLNHLETNGGLQTAVFINEAAMYMLAFRSNKAEQQGLAYWLENVLNKIRKTTFYNEVLDSLDHESPHTDKH